MGASDARATRNDEGEAVRFSVIIPAHDVEAYVGQAVDSVLTQSFKDWELLVIADSCSDGTVNAVRQRAVTPVVVTAGSAGRARNVGLDRARGEYVLFLDADDYFISPVVFARIDAALREAGAPDILHFGFMMGAQPRGIHSNGGNMWPNIWSRAWKRDAIGSTRFNDLRSGQDLYFCQDMFAKPGLRAAELNELLVQYRYPREGSLTWERLRCPQPGAKAITHF